MSGPEDMVVEIRVSGGALLPMRVILKRDSVQLECINKPPESEAGKGMLTTLAHVVYGKLMDFADGYDDAKVVTLTDAEQRTLQ